MSSTTSIISGSVALWFNIGFTIIAQLALVPVFLTYWNPQAYGIWIALQTLLGIIYIIDEGHQTFLEFEFFKIGKKNINKIGQFIASGLVLTVFIYILIFILITLIYKSGILPIILGDIKIMGEITSKDVFSALLAICFSNFLRGGIAGLLGKPLYLFGYYPRMEWWTMLTIAVSSLSPAIAVLFGADFLIAAIVQSIVIIISAIPVSIDIYFSYHFEKIRLCHVSLKLGYFNFIKSLILSIRILLENFRQQGIRLLLAPLAGAVGLATFSTIRTGANVAQKGLATITQPLMPELMTFIHKKDQERSIVSFGFIWFMVLAFLIPALVFLQTVVEPLYIFWTRGELEFDPLLFGLLSLSIIVFAVAQPAFAVIKGNNLLPQQLIVSSVSSSIVIGGMLFSIPKIGIIGAGIFLLLAEIVATVAYRYIAKNWLIKNGLKWPDQLFEIANLSLFIAAAGIGAIIYIPQVKWVILIICQILLIWNVWRYWNYIPEMATRKVRSTLKPLIKKFISY
jgi:hypothetical protein